MNETIAYLYFRDTVTDRVFFCAILFFLECVCVGGGG
jgi:hypothetical protein